MGSVGEMIKSNSDKVLKVPIFCILSVLIVIIIFKFIRKEGITKYVFGLAMLGLSLILLIVSLTNITAPVALTTLEFFVLTLASGVISLCAAWFLDLFFTKDKPKKARVKKAKKPKKIKNTKTSKAKKTSKTKEQV